MTSPGNDLMVELRRPFRLRGPFGHRGVGAVTLFSIVLVAVMAGWGLSFGSVSAPDGWLLAPMGNSVMLSIDTVRETFPGAIAHSANVWLWVCLIALLPLAFAMMRRAHSTGLPLMLPIVLVIPAAISALALVPAAAKWILFPMTRGLWVLATDGGRASSETAVGLVIVHSPFFFFTEIADVLLIAFVGLLTAAAAMLARGGCIALSFVPARKELCL